MVDYQEKFYRILNDLKLLFSKTEISGNELDNFLDSLSTDEVKNYVKNIARGSKPEVALRETFFNENSPFIKYLFPNFRIVPELSIKRVGFADYRIEAYGINIIIELKLLFEAHFKGNTLDKIKQKPLNWQDHKSQVHKYIREDDYKYAVLTDLKDWYFFSKSKTYNETYVEFINSSDVFTFVNELEKEQNFIHFLERTEHLSVKDDLDKKFFNSLKEWVKRLSEINFTCDENTKIASVIYLINKFIFIQTLDDYGIIEINRIRKEFSEIERKWHYKGDYQVLKRFIENINEWFYEYYDTELFANHQFMDYVDVNDEKNLERLTKSLKSVLGLLPGQTNIRWTNGVTHYNFKFIDEDILGKAYETFLADVRREQGIYYTPKYVTQYIPANTIGLVFDKNIKLIQKALEKKNFEEVKQIIREIIEIKVLDPACGSGSFLIKSLKIIYQKYYELIKIVDDYSRKYGKLNGLEMETPEENDHMSNISKYLKTSSERELLSKILVRHIHGNDLDSKALDVAKVNLWLEAIKLSPNDFKVETIGRLQSHHVLPNLSMNLTNGNTLIGLSEKDTIKYLSENFKDKIIGLYNERNAYLSDTTNPEHVGNIVSIKKEIRKKLNQEFEKYLVDNKLSHDVINQTKIFHWALEYWYCFFDKEGNLLEEENQGFTVIVGNPPYFSGITVPKSELKFFENFFGELWAARNDISYYFVLRGLFILKKKGYLSYIFPRYYIKSHYAKNFRNYLKHQTSIVKLIDTENFQVFEDANILTTVIILNGTNKPDNIVKFIRVKLWKKFGEELFSIIKEGKLNKDIERIEANQSELSEEVWEFVSAEDKKIIEKIRSNSTPLVEFCDIGKGMSTGYNNAYEVKKEDIKKEHLEESGIRKLLKNGDIRRFHVNDNQHYVIYLQSVDDIDELPNIKKHLLNFKKEIDERKNYDGPWYKYTTPRNIDIFESNLDKVVVPFMAVENRFAIDREKSIPTSGDVHAILFKKDYQDDIYLFLAILNSNLIMWYHKKTTQLKRDDYIEFNKKQLEKLPIRLPKEKKLIKELKEISQKLETYSGLKEEYLLIMNKKVKILSNNNITLYKLIENDLKKIREGNANSVIILESSPILTELDLNRNFDNFKLQVESNNLTIFGVKSSEIEELLTLKIKDVDLTSIIYYAIDQLLNSNIRCNTLLQLLVKSEIPLILPNPWENTKNIIKQVALELQQTKIKGTTAEDRKLSLSSIIKQIETISCKLDSLLMKLYGLDKKEVRYILNNLDVSNTYKEVVLNSFKDIS